MVLIQHQEVLQTVLKKEKQFNQKILQRNTIQHKIPLGKNPNHYSSYQSCIIVLYSPPRHVNYIKEYLCFNRPMATARSSQAQTCGTTSGKTAYWSTLPNKISDLN